MSEKQPWNDESREALRRNLRSCILGELRLANNDHERILDTCREVYITEDCPRDDWDEFIQCAADELHRAAARLSAEKVTWPDETECDRLDRAEEALRERGILLWQVSPCCDTCTRAELGSRIDEIDSRYPGFRAGLRGYAFFIDQNLPEMLAETTEISVYLGYGWFSPDDSNVAPEVYKENALGIAHVVCKCLRGEGFEVDWNGDLSRKILLKINWQRRSLLE